jgi:hypothetical protein
MEPFNNEIDNDELYDDSYIDPEVFLLIGNSLVVNFQKTKSEEDLFILKEFLKKEKEKQKEKEENKRAIKILQQKIKEYEEQQKQKNSGFFSNLFTKKKDLFYENLESEKYFYNKTLLDELLRKVEQIHF